MRRSLAVALLALLAGCAGSGHEREAIVFGTASWPEGAALDPGARVVVYLADASGPETPLAVELQKLDNPEPAGELVAYDIDEDVRLRSPHAFALPVPTEKLDPSHDYKVQVAVVSQGRPVLAVTDPPFVLTKGRPRQVDLVLSPVTAP